MNIPQEKINALYDEYNKLKEEIMDPSKMSDRRYYGKISRRYKDLEATIQCLELVTKLQSEISESKELIKLLKL